MSLMGGKRTLAHQLKERPVTGVLDRCGDDRNGSKADLSARVRNGWKADIR
jgi:hypothetical protein